MGSIRTQHGFDKDVAKVYYIPSYQLKFIKMRAKLADKNHCAASFLSRAAAIFCRYCYTTNPVKAVLIHLIKV